MPLPCLPFLPFCFLSNFEEAAGFEGASSVMSSGCCYWIMGWGFKRGLDYSWAWRKGDRSLFNFSAIVKAALGSNTSLGGSVFLAAEDDFLLLFISPCFSRLS